MFRVLVQSVCHVMLCYVMLCYVMLYYVQSTCTECMLCYVILCLLCYAMVGCCVVPCHKNFSAQSDPVSFCASDNKTLVTCNLNTQPSDLESDTQISLSNRHASH